MERKRATAWATAALLALVLPTAGLVASCGSDAENGETQEAGSGLEQTVSADEVAEDRVARITFFDGEVAARPVGAEEWETLDVNEPIFEGYEVYADEGSHAELMLGEAKYARFGDGCDLTVTQLDPNWAQFELGSGVMTLALDSWAEDEYYEINTPAGAFIPQQAGSYRVDVLPNGDTRVVVTEGVAVVTTPEGQFELVEGDVVTLPFGTPAEVDVVSAAAPQYHDDWDDWSYERDIYYDDYYDDYYARYDVPEPIQAFESRNDIYGIMQLAAYGAWLALDDDDDRYCWRPTVALQPGWSPYSNGYWDYTPVTGWTWISHEEWGWAPYHYGRWDYRDDHGWLWFPDHGPRVTTVSLYRETYRWYPSQVYVYQPPQTNYYAWVPLAPGEPYIPYTYTHYYEPRDVRVVDFRPRFLREQRAIYYVADDDLFKRVRPRRAEGRDLRRFVALDGEDLRVARLPKPDRIVALGEVAPERVRPPRFAKERPVVVSQRALERRQQRRERRGGDDRRLVADAREVRKAEQKQLRVNKRQLAADEQVAPLRQLGGKGDRAERRELRQQQRELAAGRGNDARTLDRAERRAQRQQDAPKADRQQRRELRQQQRQERPQARQQVDRRLRVDRQERRAKREQQRALRQQRATPQVDRQQRVTPKADRQQQRELRQRQRPERQARPQAERQQRRALRQQAARPQVDREQRRALRQQQRAARQEAAPRVERRQQRAARQQAAPRVERQQRAARRQERQAQPRAERQQRREARQAARAEQGGQKAARRGGGGRKN